MGTNCAPLLANLYLFYYEYSYMKKLMKTNFLQARRFNNTVRYIDDLLTLNNPGFSDEIANIYPPELVLKRTTENPLCVSYLDICITLGQHRFFTTIFDKRDNFNFDIVNFPFLSSNIPTNPAYGVYISQLIRISRICCEYNAFIKRHYMITSRLIRQGFCIQDCVIDLNTIVVGMHHSLINSAPASRTTYMMAYVYRHLLLWP